MTDKVHWTFDVDQAVVKAALSLFGIGCIVENNVPKARYYVLQKYAGAVCFLCGSRSHGRRHCRGSVFCQWCWCRTHNKSVCAFKFMPCTHCGVVGHYKGRQKSCPKWRGQQSEAATAAAAVAPADEVEVRSGDGEIM